MNLTLRPPPWATELLSDFTDMQRNPLQLTAENRAQISYDLPDDVYFEYAYADAEGRVRADPDNPRRAPTLWLPEASAVVGPDYRPDPLAMPSTELARGATERLRLESEALDGQVRRATIYTPAGHEGQRLPLVLLQDGVAFFRFAKFHLVAEALLAEGQIRPARFVFVEPVDRQHEYGFLPAYREFLSAELLPRLDQEFNFSGERIWVGASLGGLLSATMALLQPDLVHALATFSGAFLGAPGLHEFYRTERSWLLDQLREGAQPPPRWYLEVGTLEWLSEINQQVAATLATRGARHHLTIRHAGHNWTSWRNGMAPALRYLLQP